MLMWLRCVRLDYRSLYCMSRAGRVCVLKILTVKTAAFTAQKYHYATKSREQDIGAGETAASAP